MDLVYERLPAFCCSCKLIGHVERDCHKGKKFGPRKRNAGKGAQDSSARAKAGAEDNHTSPHNGASPRPLEDKDAAAFPGSERCDADVAGINKLVDVDVSSNASVQAEHVGWEPAGTGPVVDAKTADAGIIKPVDVAVFDSARVQDERIASDPVAADQPIEAADTPGTHEHLMAATADAGVGNDNDSAGSTSAGDEDHVSNSLSASSALRNDIHVLL